MAIESELDYVMNPGQWPSNVLPLRHRDGRDGCLVAGHGPKVFLVPEAKLDIYEVSRDKIDYEQYTTHRNLLCDWHQT